MSFSEMMESARGPGVIGMLMALFILIGFGFLFTFAFDERLQGEDHTIEGLLKSQGKEIENIKASIARGEERLARGGMLRQIEKELREHNARSPHFEARMNLLSGNKTASNDLLAQKAAEFEKYKDDYRRFVRAKANGQTIESLKTRDGSVYRNVTVRDINPVGMQIMHDGGYKRVFYEDLPADLQDYYQFDAKQKEEALARENSQQRDHETAVAVVKEAQSQQNSERREKEEQARRNEMVRGISIRQSRIQLLQSEIQSLEAAIPLESQKRISRAPEMRTQLSNKRQLLETLSMEIARMQSSLSQ